LRAAFVLIGSAAGFPPGRAKPIADRVEIEALRGELSRAAMMRDYDRLASLSSWRATQRPAVRACASSSASATAARS
jgi:hypothetical protein